MGFVYALGLKLMNPLAMALVLLVVSAALRKKELARRICFWLAVAVLFIGGNGWVVKYSTRYLENQYPPLGSPAASGSPASAQADCILVLGGGAQPKIPPRPTVEVDDAGDRVLYAAYLFRHKRAQHILCTGNVSTGYIAARPTAEDMAELLEDVGVPKEAIILEEKARNTHEHGVYVPPILRDRGFKRVLLVTSAVHMPRAMGVFRKACPGIEFVAAPTDFRSAELGVPWYRQVVKLIPTPANCSQFSETMHEYVGIAWYWVRGWV